MCVFTTGTLVPYTARKHQEKKKNVKRKNVKRKSERQHENNGRPTVTRAQHRVNRLIFSVASREGSVAILRVPCLKNTCIQPPYAAP